MYLTEKHTCNAKGNHAHEHEVDGPTIRWLTTVVYRHFNTTAVQVGSLRHTQMYFNVLEYTKNAVYISLWNKSHFTLAQRSAFAHTNESKWKRPQKLYSYVYDREPLCSIYNSRANVVFDRFNILSLSFMLLIAVHRTWQTVIYERIVHQNARLFSIMLLVFS